MISVIIPAHNEEAVIGRCLAALTSGAAPEELDVIVVSNGSDDRTVELARSFAPMVRVIDSPVASKSHALNLGDEAASGFPRFYVDADVRISLQAAREVVRALHEGAVLAAAPRMHVDLTGCPWSVRAFYRTWNAMPYCRAGMVGSGVYAVSESGRARWDLFPRITADDGFARLQFAPCERATLTNCEFTIHAPRTLRDLIAIKTRGHFGNLELKEQFPHLWRNEDVRHGRALLKLAQDPRWWPALLVYAFVRLVARRRARARFRNGDYARWDRDDSSRQADSRVDPLEEQATLR